MSNNPNCPVCPGVGRYLGALGNLAHFRCESCASMFSEEAGNDEGDPEQDEFVISGEIDSAGGYADDNDDAPRFLGADFDAYPY